MLLSKCFWTVLTSLVTESLTQSQTQVFVVLAPVLRPVQMFHVLSPFDNVKTEKVWLHASQIELSCTMQWNHSNNMTLRS